MSYDVFAHGFRDGEEDPAPERRAALIEVLAPFTVEGPDRFGCRRTKTADGGEADFYLSNDPGAGFMVNHFSPGQTLELIFRAARAAGCVILGDFPPVLTDADQLHHLPSWLTELQPVLLASGAEFGALMDEDPLVLETGRRRLARRI